MDKLVFKFIFCDCVSFRSHWPRYIYNDQSTLAMEKQSQIGESLVFGVCFTNIFGFLASTLLLLSIKPVGHAKSFLHPVPLWKQDFP